MPHLSLTGVSEDGAALQLVDDDGTSHTLAITPDLRAALRQTAGRVSDGARPAPREAMMTNALRPREIQARIRSGESAESVAEAARTTLEKIMPFAGPVLAERQHVADRAQRSSVRRSPGDTGAARTLGDAVAAHLRGLNVPEDIVEWDAWRREDGRWTLVGTFATEQRQGTAGFSFDPRGNFVTLDDDDARWLVGDAGPPAPSETAATDDLSEARRRRLSAVPVGEVPPTEHDPDGAAEGDEPLGDDTIGMLHGEPGHAHPEPTLDALLPMGPPFGEEEPRRRPADEPAASTDAEHPAASGEDDADAVAGRTRRAAKRRGRTSVPSWDEIMFGGGDQ